MLADDPSWVRLARGQRAHLPLFAQPARRDHGAGRLRSDPAGAPPGHSRGVLVRCRGKGDAPAMAVATTTFSGRAFSVPEVTLIREIVRDCSGLSRMELARTVCELLRWRRPNGRLKARECREFLERLDAGGALVLPDKRQGRATGSVTRVPRTAAGEPGPPLVGSVRDVEPLRVERVREPAERLLFRELVGRYHYLGHTVPFGAHLRYLVFASRPARAVVGCLQFSSPAWRMAVRDRWIGWDDATRARNLQRVVNNSRFLLLPWVAVSNLASAVLARGLGQLVVDWPRHYKLEPWLVETLVDPRRYHGGCYRAANWVALGATSGRGRMDRHGRRAGEAPKTVLVYPVVRNAKRRLRER